MYSPYKEPQTKSYVDFQQLQNSLWSVHFRTTSTFLKPFLWLRKSELGANPVQHHKLSFSKFFPITLKASNLQEHFAKIGKKPRWKCVFSWPWFGLAMLQIPNPSWKWCKTFWCFGKTFFGSTSCWRCLWSENHIGDRLCRIRRHFHGNLCPLPSHDHSEVK